MSGPQEEVPMESMDTVRERFEALAQQTEPFQPQTPAREAPTRRGARQRWGRLPWRVAALLVLGLVLAPPGQSQAETFRCGAGDVPCLIETINEANANGQANTIRLEAGIYTLTAVAQAQEYTFTTIDLPATDGAPGRLINLVGIAHDGTMAGDDNSPHGLGSRLSPALDVTPVTCLPGTFDRYPFASRLGPEVVAMNNALTVVGNDEGLVALHGFQQPLAGDCSFFLFPGAVGTLFTGIDDRGRIVGQYWNDPAVEFGLLRFHAFVKDDDTLTPLTDGSTNDVLWPTGINAAGDIIGYAFRDVQPDNSYIYQAFYYSGGIFTWLDGPRSLSTKQSVWLVDV